MAKILYDVSDVEAGGGEQPQPAIYDGKIRQVTHRTKKSNGDPTNDLEVVVDIGAPYSGQWTYIQLGNPASAWKLREFTDALGLKPKGELDPKKIEGKLVRVKIAADTDLDGNYRGKIKNLLPPDEDVAEANGASASSDGEDFSEWTDQDLKDELADRDITVSGRWTRDKAIEALGGGSSGDPEAAAAEPEADDPVAADDYDTWSLDDLKAEVEEKGIGGNISGRKTKEKLIEALRALADGPSGDAETTVEDDYDEWTEAELTDEIAARNETGAEIKVTGRKTKEKLIEALRTDDKTAPF